MNQGTILGSQIGRWIILAAVVALLGALLLTTRPVGAQQDTAPTLSNAETQFDYAEDGTEHVTTFRAKDPENMPVFWTVGGADAADFTIDGGTLRFKSPPDYEVPTDRHDDTNNNGEVELGEDAAGNNVYKVTVRFSAGGEDGNPDPTDDYDGDDLGEIDLTINVTNENDPGSVVISPRQPQVGTMLTAILTDEDNIAPGVGEWQWARSDSMTGAFKDIPDLSDEMTYRPTIDDLNMYLRVTVVYVDRAGADPRTVRQVSEFEVRTDIVTSNQRPKFPDQRTLTTTENAIVRDDTDRFISETAAAGDRVGAPVTAFDDRTDIEVITYSLRDDEETLADSDTNPDTPMHNDGHAASFNIDEVTGQITVSASATLNADGTPTTESPNPYNVVVRAVDGDGETQDIDVTIGVLQAAEPPMIERVYLSGRFGAGHAVGDRAPTEMSHYELDRDNQATASVIDTNLDTADIEAATYFANDPEGDTLTWSLEGPDSGSLGINPNDPATNATLTAGGRDFENPGDANGDNVYEVTIVVTDNTGLTDKLDVTLKVLNSTDDNEPGEVSFLNRQPEVATELTAELEDQDTPVTRLNWQWYRAQAISSECDGRTPTGDEHRGFIADTTEANVGGEQVEQITIPDGGGTWTKIPGATGTGSMARYTPEANDVGELTDVGRCLRATFTYRDAVDRTHSDADDRTTDVDETLEGTFGGAEQPVKIIDAQNQAPVFKESDYGSARVSEYRANVMENSDPVEIMEADAAVDVHEFDIDGDNTPDPVENDSGPDLLTYSLSGRDAAAFSILGTVDSPGANVENDGTLTFSGGADFEVQREYRVRITATDPGGDRGFVDVIVDITNINERPGFADGKGRVVYMENGTVAVDTYRAADPEGSGITYSLVTEAIAPETDDDGSGAIEAVETPAFEDEARFKIGSISGILEFKESPNFEVARDDDTDNMYQVTVQATVSDNENPRHFATQEVTVIVTDVNEAPVFSPTTDALEITENPDDPNKEPPTAAGYLYLLNRGVGKPSADLPADPNLDVGIPVIADDDDNNATFITGLTDISETRQLRDGLTYELSGADAGYFHVVPATGQILTEKKLDYEAKDEFKVTLKATDPEGLYDTIVLTINVLDVDEVPVPDILRIAGENSHDYEENGAEAVGEYTVAAGGDATPGAWSLEGTDASSFRLTGSGNARMLEFASAPDHEDPMGGANDDSNTYKVTLKVTDSSESDVYGTFAVSVTVTNVSELGTLAGSRGFPHAEGDTDTGETYTLSGGDGTSTIRWMLDGADASLFRLDGTSMSKMLEFKSAPDYEMPADADTDNTYMVTVKAEAGGEMAMVEVSVTVTDVSEVGTLAGSSGFPHAEGGTDTGETYTLSGGDGTSTIRWMLDGVDASQFMLDGTGMSRMLKFKSAPDYEMPADADTNNIYMVTVKADAGSEMEMVEVSVTVIDVDELGMVDGMESPSYAENRDDAVATYTVDSGSMADTAVWTLNGADASQFTLDGTGMSRMLMFRSAPDYEMPADADTNNSYMVTVKAEAGSEIQMVEVTVTVTDVDELGALSGPGSFTQAEGGTDAMETYTLSGGDGTSTVSWMLDGADASQFTLDGTGMSRMLMFESAPDYEMPRGQAMSDTNTNTYMVTVKAEAGGEIEMVEVTVTVTEVDELGALSGPGSFTQAEGGTDAMETYTLSGGDGTSTVSWMLDGADASQFTLDGTGMSRMLMFESAPDYEMPRGQAMSDTNTNTYMVTVKAEAGGEIEMVEVTVTVTNEEEMGTVSLSPESPVAGSPVTATLTDPDGGITDLTWTWETSSDMATWSAATGAVVSEGTTSTYTSVEDDADDYLRATASYTDSYGSGNSESGVSGVVVDVDVNVAPEFPSGPATRSIAENTAAGTNIGAPVAATDANGDTLVYSLEGTDMASFGIVATTGQLTTLAALDYEDKDTYNVVVKATDPDGLSDTIDVTINVTDVDDTPVDPVDPVVPVDPVDTYDTNETAGIQTDELFDAIDDFFAGQLTIDELFDVIDAYFASA